MCVCIQKIQTHASIFMYVCIKKVNSVHTDYSKTTYNHPDDPIKAPDASFDS